MPASKTAGRAGLSAESLIQRALEFKCLFGIFAIPLCSLGLLWLSAAMVVAQPSTFAGNSQHTGQYYVPAQPLNRILWSTSIDLKNSAGNSHYGAPLITPSNTVLVPIRGTNGFKVSAFDGATGRLKYTLSSDYISPPSNWLPTYQPAVVTNATAMRLYYPGAGGTMFYVENPDSDTPSPSVRLCFYTAVSNYTANATSFNTNVFVNTPITADTNGTIFFGFRMETNGAPAPLSTTNGGFARIDSSDSATYVLAGLVSGDNQIGRDSHNCAPALSNDGQTLYVVVKSFTTANYAYLLGLDSTTLIQKYRVMLHDPRSNSRAGVPDDATASPMVAPDGDVFFGVFANPNNGSRGFLLHFSGDLAVQKVPSAFGWDYTPAIVPAAMVPGYTGPSSYLLFSKYNNYAGFSDGDGINKIALLDPNATQLDPHPSASGLREMREIRTIQGCTPDAEYLGSSYPYAAREWCINSAIVNPATDSVFAPSEDGRIYRWNFASNSLSEVLILGAGFGEPYVPSVLGPDGTVYTLNGGKLFALGGFTNIALTLYSSAADVRTALSGQSLTFTANITNLNIADPTPSGTIDFKAVSYHDLTPITNILATHVPITNGAAFVTVSNLATGTNYLGNHFVTATYNGDSNYPPASTTTLMQKVHVSGTFLTLSAIGPRFSSNAVTFTATANPMVQGFGKPTGMVEFWDSTNLVAQVPLNTNGLASFTTTNINDGIHSITANYHSDTLFASSVASLLWTPQSLLTVSLLSSGSVEVTFTNVPGASFTVLGAPDLLLPQSSWNVLGLAVEVTPGNYQFTDTQATNSDIRFYRVRSP